MAVPPKITKLSDITAEQLEKLKAAAADAPAAKAIAKIIKGEVLTPREAKAFDRFYRRVMSADGGADDRLGKDLTKTRLDIECWRRSVLMGQASRAIATELGVDKATVCRAVKRVSERIPAQLTHSAAMGMVNTALQRMEALADCAIAEANRASGNERAQLVSAGLACSAKLIEVMQSLGLVRIVPLRVESNNLNVNVNADGTPAPAPTPSPASPPVNLKQIERGLRSIFKAEEQLAAVTAPVAPPLADASPA